MLSAVFLPMVFFGGSTGVIYRQFSATIVSAMALSVFLALTFSPALAANVLRRKHATVEESWLGRTAPALAHGIEAARVKFNDGFQRLIDWYVGNVGRVVERKWLFLGIYAGVCAAADAAVLAAADRLPPDRRPGQCARSSSGFRRARPWPARARSSGRSRIISSTGRRRRTSTPSSRSPAAAAAARRARIPARPSSTLRRSTSARAATNSAEAIVERASGAFRGLRDAQVFALVPGAIRGLGQSAGFTMELQNTSGMSREQIRRGARPAARRRERRSTAGPGPAQRAARRRQPQGQYRPVPRLAALGLSTSDVNSTLSTAWGGRYVNDFIDRGRVKRVYVQGDAPYRAAPPDIGHGSSATTRGEMVPFSLLRADRLDDGADDAVPLPGLSVFEIQGQAAPGESSGEAMDADREACRRRSRASASPGRAHRTRSGSLPDRRRCSTRSR